MENKHGVDLGETYSNASMCQQFTCCVGSVFLEELLDDIKESPYLTVLIDGSTDTSIVENELIYVSYIKNGERETRYFKIVRIDDAHAVGIKSTLLETFAKYDIDLTHKIVGFMADGASVNFGRKNGLVALLKNPCPWLIAVHCFNHRLELAAKDAFKKTYFENISEMLMAMYYLYHNSPKRLRQFKELAHIMDEQVKLPQKAVKPMGPDGCSINSAQFCHSLVTFQLL